MKNKFKILVSIIILSLSLVGCTDNFPKRLKQDLEDNSKAKKYDLLKYKDTYVGDNSSVGNIIVSLPGSLYSSRFSLETNKKPYGIVINYKVNQSLGEENYNKFWSDKKVTEFLEKNSVILLSLVENADFVEFNVDNIGEKPYKYTRSSLEQKYGDKLQNLFNENSEFEEFLNS